MKLWLYLQNNGSTRYWNLQNTAKIVNIRISTPFTIAERFNGLWNGNKSESFGLAILVKCGTIYILLCVKRVRISKLILHILRPENFAWRSSNSSIEFVVSGPPESHESDKWYLPKDNEMVHNNIFMRTCWVNEDLNPWITARFH